MEHENSGRPTTPWDSSLEAVDVKESVTWLQNCTTLDFTCEEMAKWKKEGNNDEYHHFCNPELRNDVLEAKNALPKDTKNIKYTKARSDSNPFGKIQSVFFMNRAALKMANIDTVTNHMFTKVDQNINFANKPGPCYFADVCAGPGGFSEYILWRTRETFKGFGFTLKKSNDFNLKDSFCVSPLTFRQFYGVKGDGDVYNPENIRDFRNKVLEATDNEGVHFVMSDGGFETNGREDEQEILAKQIYACQCLVALEILRVHGHFVTKVFDVFTCFSVGIVYLMYKCFEKICILKPNTSRPANSERYLICSNLRDSEQVQEIRNYLKGVVARFWQLDEDGPSITEIVPLDTLKRDQDFYSYICDSNNRIARRQTVHLKKFLAFFNNDKLKDERQYRFRKECLKYWKIPDVGRKNYPRRGNFGRAEMVPMYNVLEAYPLDFSKLTPNPAQWQYAFLQSKECSSKLTTFFADQEDEVIKLDDLYKTKVPHLKLTCGTVLFGELVKETHEREDNSNQQERSSLHVIDALSLGPCNIANLPLEERMSKIEVYCKMVNRELSNAVQVRAKTLRSLNLLVDDYRNLNKTEKGIYEFPLPLLGRQHKRQFYDVNSVLLVNPCMVSSDPREPKYLRFKVNEPTLRDQDNLEKFVEFIELHQRN